MSTTIKIGVVGDFDGRPSHIATNEAIRHCAVHLGLKQETHWITTESLLNGSVIRDLFMFDALWCAPGSPYKSAQGAMNAIQFAREQNYPFIGTCGGFQHVVLEIARDLLDLSEVQQPDFNPYAPNLFISALNCSLNGDTRNIFLIKGTQVAQVYLAAEAEEQFNCNFELNSQFKNQIVTLGFLVSGTDAIGDTRILELPKNHFFVATLFQPQLSSTPDHPHKLILAFLKCAAEFSQQQKHNPFFLSEV